MKQPSVATLVVLYVMAGVVLAWVFTRVVHRDRQLEKDLSTLTRRAQRKEAL